MASAAIPKEASILEKHLLALNSIHDRLASHNDRLDVVMGRLSGNGHVNCPKSPEQDAAGFIQRAELLIEKLHQQLDAMDTYITGIEKL